MNIYQYVAENIILLGNILCTPSENKIPIFSLPNVKAC